jgi:hypothetical protein
MIYGHPMTSPMTPKPDPRWREMFPDQAALEAEVQSWPVADTVPNDMAEVLRVVRGLLIQSYNDYEFMLVAITWGLLALEGGLVACLDFADSSGLKELIGEAHTRQVVTDNEAKALKVAADLRNKIVHGKLRPFFAPSFGVIMIEDLHQAICDLYDRAASGH